MAWFRFQGPPGALGDDLRAAAVALEAAKPYIAESERRLARFLPAGRSPVDYAGWLDFDPEDMPERPEYGPE